MPNTDGMVPVIRDDESGEMVTVDAQMMRDAYRIHTAIMEHGQTYHDSQWSFRESLEEMRRRRLFLALGHKSWGEYCQVELDATANWANGEIQTLSILRESGVAQHRFANKTQARIIGRLEAEQRTAFLAAHNIEEMTTRQVEAAVKEFQDKLAVAKAECDTLAAQVEQMKAAEERRRTETPSLTAKSYQETISDLKRERAEKRQLQQEVADLKAREPEVKIVPVPETPPEVLAELEQLRSIVADKTRTVEQQQKDLDRFKKWLSETQKDLEGLRAQVDRNYELDQAIRQKEERAGVLEGLIQQMESQFEDGKRNRRGGMELMRIVYPLDRVIWSIARDVHALRQEGVGGRCDDDDVSKLAKKLREVANDLEAIIKDRKNIALTAQVEVLKSE